MTWIRLWYLMLDWIGEELERSEEQVCTNGSVLCMIKHDQPNIFPMG